jgi:hypothetical protein
MQRALMIEIESYLVLRLLPFQFLLFNSDFIRAMVTDERDASFIRIDLLRVRER